MGSEHFKLFNFYDGSVGDDRLKYHLDQRIFVNEKFLDDSNLVSKNVGVGTSYEVHFVMFYCI